MNFIEKVELKNLKQLLIDKGIITQKELDDKMSNWKFKFNIELKPSFNIKNLNCYKDSFNRLYSNYESCE